MTKEQRALEIALSALRVIYTWATFRGGVELVPDHVKKLTLRSLTQIGRILEKDKKRKKLQTCRWVYDELGGSWESRCGLSWIFTADGPKENQVTYCPKCGKKARAIEPK